jgi:hypothetical protein
MDEASRSRGRALVWDSDRVFVRPVGMRLRGLYLERMEGCEVTGGVDVDWGCLGLLRRGWFGSLTGHADGVAASGVRLNGEDFESDLCIGHDGGGLAAVGCGAGGLGRRALGFVSDQNQPMVTLEYLFRVPEALLTKRLWCSCE